MTATALTPPTVIPPGLEPLKESHQADDIERELAEVLVEVFESFLRPAMRRLNTYGMPHRGTFEVVERFVKADGLTMERANAEPYMAELFRAWRALNPRRGTAFLSFYLQLLFPGQWTVVQLWQDPLLPYPAGASEAEGPTKWLTSRVRVALAVDDAGMLNTLAGSFRAALPARLVLDMTVLNNFENQLRIANVAQLSQYQEFEGTAV